MKHLIILLFLLASSATEAQTITGMQREKALETATRFCGLLSQYSSTKGAHVSNDSKIFELCSNKNISTYNDLDGNNEDLLVSYLFSILGKHGCNLDMTFSEPVIEECFGLPLFHIYEDLDSYTNIELADYSDIYIIINTTQNIGTLNKSIGRKIIYSCNEDKILSFTTDDSPFINLQKTFKAFSKKDYGSVYGFVDNILSHKRFDNSKKQSAATIAVLSALLSGNIVQAERYEGHVEKGFYNYSLGNLCHTQGKYIESMRYFEKAAYAGCELAYPMLGILHAFEETGLRNPAKAKEFLNKGIRSEDASAARLSEFYYALMGLNNPKDFYLSKTQIISYMKSAAEKEFQPAYIPLSILYEEKGDPESAAIWDEKAADAGSRIGLARFGKYLLSSADDETRRKLCDYIRGIDFSGLESELDLLGKNTGLQPSFPENEEQIKILISKY